MPERMPAQPAPERFARRATCGANIAHIEHAATEKTTPAHAEAQPRRINTRTTDESG